MTSEGEEAACRFWAAFIGRYTIYVYAVATRIPLAVTVSDSGTHGSILDSRE